MAKPKKMHPSDLRDLEMIRSAVAFSVFYKRDPASAPVIKRFEIGEASHAEALAAARAFVASLGIARAARQPMVYAILPAGSVYGQQFVPDSYQA